MTAADVEGSLAAAGHRMTSPRRAVIELILSQSGAFGSADLVADARRRHLGAGRATIFRTLELLGEAGLVERLDLPNGDHAYVRCDPGGHHHHLVCSRCRRSVDLEDLGLTPLVRKLERRTGYSIDRHRVELFGLCPVCQTTTPASAVQSST